MSTITNLEQLLAAGHDNAMLRFGLGKACLEAQRNTEAVEHLRRAVAHDPNYSAAWKLLGKGLVAERQDEDAAAAYRQGIAVAEGRGDIQAAKEMKVFLKRLQRRE